MTKHEQQIAMTQLSDRHADLVELVAKLDQELQVTRELTSDAAAIWLEYQTKVHAYKKNKARSVSHGRR
ncbi:MAG: hypothetical protein AAF718_07060 [Pseudomonadota bacterium]